MSEDAARAGVFIDDGADEKTGKTTTIIVNATPHEVHGHSISYERVVSLAYNGAPPSGPNVVITVTYSRGEHGEEGSMLPGDEVKLKTKMIFDVTATDRS